MQPPTQHPFALTLARAAVSATGDDPTLIHVSWREHHPGRGPLAVQVYVNETLADAVLDPSRTDTWLHVDRTRPIRIELLAVDPADALTAQPNALTQRPAAAHQRAAATVLRDAALPLDTRVTLAAADQETTAPLWRDTDPRAGFGALFGLGAFGFDLTTAPGLGVGALGLGPLGFDADPLTLNLNHLPPGTHTPTLSAHHAAGPIATPDLPPVTSTPLPAPVRDLTLDAANDQLSWTLPDA